MIDMGLLDRFIKKAKEQEQKSEQDSKPFAIGETKTDGVYQFTYTSDPITERCGDRGEDERIVGYNYGWHISTFCPNSVAIAVLFGLFSLCRNRGVLYFIAYLY